MTRVEHVDTEWYKGACRGSTGFFPISYVKLLVSSINNSLIKYNTVVKMLDKNQSVLKNFSKK